MNLIRVNIAVYLEPECGTCVPN